MRVKRKRRKTKIFGQSNWKNGDAINWVKDDCRSSMLFFLSKGVGRERRLWFLLGTC